MLFVVYLDKYRDWLANNNGKTETQRFITDKNDPTNQQINLLINMYKFYVSAQKESASSTQKLYFCNRLQNQKKNNYIYKNVTPKPHE